MALWGRGSQARFDGREGTFSLDGEVTTGMLGADYARGKWLVGLALAQSAGEGDYRDSDVSPRPDGQSCPSDPEGADAELCRNAVRAGDGSVEASLDGGDPLFGVAGLEAPEALGRGGLRHGRGDARDRHGRELQVRHPLEHGGGRGSGATFWRPRRRVPARRWR